MLKQSEPTVNLSATVPLSVFQQITDVATEVKISRSKAIKELILLGLKKHAEDKTTHPDTGE